MTYGSGLRIWCRLLGACAAIVGAAGCNGGQTLTASGTGGSGEVLAPATGQAVPVDRAAERLAAVAPRGRMSPDRSGATSTS